MFPATAFNVYIGSLLGSLAELESPRPQTSRLQQVFFYVGLVATVAVVIYVTRLAKAALSAAMPDVIDGDSPVVACDGSPTNSASDAARPGIDRTT
jgi:hypothetical protein